ncbi:uncharacterized protein JCM15063_000403 [Sporobolomyces koalae]|uniref:uncharacterized protein n=1 Tax=Sporobolomyces koalae TaxID=500713 RepID=UPI003179BBE9
MAEPHNHTNVFDQPYTSSSPPSRQDVPRLVVPEADIAAETVLSSHSTSGAPTGSAISTPMQQSDSAGGGSRATRRVQWPAELGRSDVEHVAIPVQQGAALDRTRSLTSPGAQDELRRALEAHNRSTLTDDETDDDDFAPRGGYTSEGVSRAASSDGDPTERLEQVKDRMDVYVDPGETDGLPDARNRNPEERSSKAAWNLVRNMTQRGGTAGGMRRRKHGGAGPAGFRGGTGANAEKDEDEEKRSHGFMHRLRDDGLADVPQDQQFGAGAGAGGGGILSALIALQRQQNESASAATSGVNTPTSAGPSTRASSINGGDSDEDDDEAERLKFIAKLHEKRANKNRLHQISGQIGNGATGVVVGAGRGAGAVIGGAGKVGGAVLGTAGRAGGAVMGGAGRAVEQITGMQSKSKSQPPSGDTTSAPTPGEPATGTASPDRPGVDAYKPKKDKDSKTFMNRVRDAVDRESRPDAAKSSAGVFGGLMLGANTIAGVATPTATTIAPEIERAGTHVSRYSSPQLGRNSPSLAGDSPETDRTAYSTANHSAPPTPPTGERPKLDSKGSHKNVFSLSLGNLKDLPTPMAKFGTRSPHDGASPRKEIADYFLQTKESEAEADRRAWEKEKRRRRKAKEKKKAQEIFITQHVAAILERQQYILKQARAFMMFGAPSHRLEAQMQATARVLEINCQVIYIPGVMLLSFGDAATHTSDIKFLKQANGLDLGKLLTAYTIYYNVVHDRLSVTDASSQLDELMVAPPKYNLWQSLIIGALASAFIQPSAFYGSFIDCLMAMPLGALLVLVQVIVSRNDLYASLFEIVIACIISFLAAAIASSQKFCFAAVVSGSVVLILPGYIVLCGSLELANRSIISGSVRLVYSILYSLFLGFGLSIGSEIYARITTIDTIPGYNDYTCSSIRNANPPWYMATIPAWWYFLTIPMFLLMLALRNGQPFFRKETILMVLIGSGGFAANYFSGKYAFEGRSDISSAIGSFAVGLLGNVYGRLTKESPFVVMVPGILVQLPSGLSNGGLLAFTDTSDNSSAYASGFQTAESLVQVAIGLTVGLFVSAALVNLVFGGGRRRGSNLSSF